MSFFPPKMSQNDWATIMSFGPATLFFYWPQKIFSGQPKDSPHFRHCLGVGISTIKKFTSGRGWGMTPVPEL